MFGRVPLADRSSSVRSGCEIRAVRDCPCSSCPSRGQDTGSCEAGSAARRPHVPGPCHGHPRHIVPRLPRRRATDAFLVQPADPRAEQGHHEQELKALSLGSEPSRGPCMMGARCVAFRVSGGRYLEVITPDLTRVRTPRARGQWPLGRASVPLIVVAGERLSPDSTWAPPMITSSTSGNARPAAPRSTDRRPYRP